MRSISGRFLSFVVVALLVPGLASAAVERRKFTAPSGYPVVEVLDDDLVHFEASAVGPRPQTSQALYTSPMVFRTDYAGSSTCGNLRQTADKTRDTRGVARGAGSYSEDQCGAG